jgi:hypothetical protein
MAAALIPTRRPLHVRLRAQLRVLKLRFLIREAEKDLAHHRAEWARAQAHMPQQIGVDEQHVASLAKQLHRAIHDL